MVQDMSQITVREVTDHQRLEAYVDGRLAGIAEYLPAKRLIAFVHTEVDPEFEGRGVGSALARAGLDMVKRTDTRFLAVCPFIAGWSARHPEYEPWRYTAASRVSD
ncbi:putative GNAT family acetyltransferase [Streptomyces sp. 3330]|uniref:GNAT family N-acetyltransferase n=1 Tax=Streptomyces sp. 3330 TaxID=2817755 RepID=UPI00285CF2A2|nr:GNAT family N-acetyltransferase [Streptomyces sp. 3330]MDR6974303.1 putative GNAT family acetyltransferase [Streptomyces sp. 3330]